MTGNLTGWRPQTGVAPTKPGWSRGSEYMDAALVVIGGRGSGLVAAAKANELGVRNTVVLEKTVRTGGNAWLAVWMLGLSGVADPPADITAWRDRAFEGMMRASEWTSEPRLIAKYVETYPDVVRQLAGKGMQFISAGYDVGGKEFTTLGLKERQGDCKVTEPSRGPGFVGSVATGLLRAECEGAGVHVLLRTRATKILLNDSETEVRAVLVDGPEGGRTLNTRGVTLAAGGFGANEDLPEKHFPKEFRKGELVNTLCTGASTGDRLLLAQEIGLRMGEDMRSGIMGPSHRPGLTRSTRPCIGRRLCGSTATTGGSRTRA
jgi:succinate dehydrogenase/fumarate reductase flavoprotein subunit